ncbi:hypothetical protein [uncultured Novosphingobium sp.]|uniref:hypothetical protein n=1 Tax=uncultured Novosphingobium sp. TaxID=292277 RepID=UPI002587CD74|nr:hypothetical protein [uncultured Novosphingobium sp.]
MQTQFDEWLRQLAAAEKGPVPFKNMTRGRLWRQDIYLPGDWSGATMRAQIRLYPDAPGDPLVTCNVFGPDLVGDTTKFQLQLGAGSAGNATGALPADGSGEGVAQFAIDVLLTPAGGVEDLLFGGVVTVLGRVTA